MGGSVLYQFSDLSGILVGSFGSFIHQLGVPPLGGKRHAFLRSNAGRLKAELLTRNVENAGYGLFIVNHDVRRGDCFLLESIYQIIW
jgi:hypothetical protein